MITDICRRAFGALLLAIALFTAAPAHAEWRRAESEHFIVYGDMNAGALRDFVRKVERFDSLLSLYYPVANARGRPKLEIFVAAGLEDMRRIIPDLETGIGGFYSASRDRVFAVVDPASMNGDSTLFHEYGHHFMFYTASAAYPGWFIEGFAEYYATAEVTANRARVGLHNPGRMNSLTQTNAWVPMEDVLRSRPMSLPASQRPGYYAQSWALTHYLLSDPQRQRALSAYLRRVAGGDDPVAALEGTIGRTPGELQADVRRYLTRITYFTIQQEFPAAEVTITSLPASTRDLIWMDLRLDRGVPEAQKAAAIAEARRLAARWPDERLGALILARAELLSEDPAAAEAALTRLVAAEDPDALRLTARAMMARAEASDDPDDADALNGEARDLLGRAYQAVPGDYRIIFALAENRSREPGFPTDNDIETLSVAVELAPQVMDVRFFAAQVHMARGQYVPAIILLSPVANNPHGGPALEPARQLLAEAWQKSGLRN